jgi:hypothetical protein
MSYFRIITLLLVSCLAASTAADEPAVDFTRDVLPILRSRCLECHGPSKQESGLRVDLRSSLLAGGDSGEPAVLAGKSQQSPLIQAVAGLDEDRLMPPEGAPLAAAEVEILRRWVDQGFHWPADFKGVEPDQRLAYWSFQPLQRPGVPAIRSSWASNPIDQFVLARLNEAGLQPSAAADQQTLLRRLTLVLHGLPPSLDQLDSIAWRDYLVQYPRLVDSLLASHHLGEHWARYWLDLVRFGETTGFEVNRERVNAWPYRDYVIRALNDDKPYDQFLREQLAGDLLASDTAATGFLVAGPYDQVKSQNKKLTLMQRQDELADIINATGTTMLGLTLGCARCHSHKFDPVSQRDYYAIQAVFAGVQHGERDLPADPSQQQQLANLETQRAAVRQQLLEFVPAARDKLQLIDEGQQRVDEGRGVSYYRPPAGHVDNPAGRRRGERFDPGADDRAANYSGGYRWWKNEPGQTTASYHLLARGHFRIWISWGNHPGATSTARYLLDRDGDPTTSDDQQQLAVIDQQLFADRSSPPADQQSTWSGFKDLGSFILEPSATILLVAGEQGDAVTADMLLLEKLDQSDSDAAAALPRVRPAASSGHNLELFQPVQARLVRFTIQSTNNGSQPCIDELEIFSHGKNVALASSGSIASSSGNLPGYEIHKLKHIHDGMYGNSHSWISNQPGKGWVQLQLAQPVMIDRIEWARDRELKFQDRVAVQYVIEASLEGTTWQTLASSNDRLPFSASQPAEIYQFAGLPEADARRGRQLQQRLAELTARIAAAQQSRRVYAGVFSDPGKTYRLYRGDPFAPREEVEPDAISAFTSLQLTSGTPGPERRLAFANWVIDPQNPLTARVIVNRLWQHLFGVGLVDTPSDFGANGTQPTHPQLLDWLAVELIDSGWSLKHVMRLIVTSSTFRQQSVPHSRGLEKDAASRLLWRYPPRRLAAEPIRDSLLSVAGTLDQRAGGPGFSGFRVEMENVRHYFALDEFGPQHWRRMIYMTKVRQEQDAVFGLFDCPDGSQVVAARSRSTTPLQALNLLNSNFVIQQAGLMAERLQRMAGEDLSEQVRVAFQLAYARAADKQELAECRAFISEQGLRAFCRALLNSNEFLFIP